MPNPAELARQVEQLDDLPCYEFLDALDEVSRRRRQRAEVPAAPASTSRDDVAAWLARRHFIADSGVREIWYLPGGAPPDEIRFLEVNDFIGSSGANAEPIEFGVDIDGAQYRLLVADVSSDELDALRRDHSLLPAGWSLVSKMTWGRPRE